MIIKLSEIINNQPVINLGVTGHVSHGKSSLVKALTGIKTQKHSSEKERNITINIGYANSKIYQNSEGKYFTAPSDKDNLLNDDGTPMKLVSNISMVDCPGHEAFMSNMISGSAVMDCSILVIASNENIPQPQTHDHFEAVKSVDIKDFLILQNKCDLIKKEENDKVLKKIKSFVKDTVAEKSNIIPSSIQNAINKQEILKNIVNMSKLKNLNDNINEDTFMIVIRSFDINRQNSDWSTLKGGVVGGSLLCGNLKVGDYVELRPGFIIGDKYRPIYSKIKSLKSDAKELKYIFSGGLVGVCLDLDPSLCKNNFMVGQVLGNIGKLPSVYNEIDITYEELKRHDNKYEDFKKDEMIVLNINAMSIDGKILKCKKNNLKIKLLKPVCIRENQKLSLFKNRITSKYLYATGLFKGGVECKKDDSEDGVLKSLNIKEREIIEIENDIVYENNRYESYEELLNNVKFKSDTNKLKLNPPVIKKVNRDIIYSNYLDLLNKINKNAEDIKYDNYLIEFIKNELSTTCEKNKDGLIMRGNFKKNHFESIILKFVSKYVTCPTCKACNSKLIRNNRNLYKKCIECGSEFCI
jgi:translation initiation factor 2 subunit 3